MHVAVIFFGVARGTATTAASIQRNVYDCNFRRGVSFYTIASLNLVERIENARTRELGVSLNASESLALKADAYFLIRQDDAHIATTLSVIQERGDFYDDDWRSIRNSLHQLQSLRRAWRMSRELPGRFDYYLFLRPDLLYLDEIDLPELARSFRSSGSIALPPWHSWGGFNDRFAFADPSAARDYAERIELVRTYCASNLMHPETFLAYALRKGRCRVGALPVRAKRVRVNGVVREENFDQSKMHLPCNPRRFSFIGRVRYHSRIMLLLQVPYVLDFLRYLKWLRVRIWSHSTP
jgi:hypothetical protein